MTKHHEIVCITRHGFDILHTEGMDAAAKVTYQSYLKDERGVCYGRPEYVRSEWLVPLLNQGR